MLIVASTVFMPWQHDLYLYFVHLKLFTFFQFFPKNIDNTDSKYLLASGRKLNFLNISFGACLYGIYFSYGYEILFLVSIEFRQKIISFTMTGCKQNELILGFFCSWLVWLSLLHSMQKFRWGWHILRAFQFKLPLVCKPRKLVVSTSSTDYSVLYPIFRKHKVLLLIYNFMKFILSVFNDIYCY